MTRFPSPETAAPDGLVHVTDGIDAAMLLDAYGNGLFPWSTAPVRWFSPDPRAIFEPDSIHLSHKLQKELRAGRHRVSFDTAFSEVVRACAEAHAAQRVWIGESFVTAYTDLHRLGHAHSVEVWQGDALVGGIYGVQIGSMFAGESMFHRVDNASKIAFAYLARQVFAVGVTLLDTQVLNNHTRSLGAVLIPRAEFLRRLAMAVKQETTFEGRAWPSEVLPWTTFEPLSTSTRRPVRTHESALVAG